MTAASTPFLHERLTEGRDRLVAAGIAPEDAAIDVDLFARTILGWDRARVLTARTEPAPAALEPRFSEWILRRARREPSAYIVGTREFWGLDLFVTRDVLTPRPETELIVEAALSIFAPAPPQMIVDVATGSGCLAVALARAWAVYFLLHFPWAHAPQALPGAVPCGARTFLHVLADAAIAWPTPAHTIVSGAVGLKSRAARGRG